MIINKMKAFFVLIAISLLCLQFYFRQKLIKPPLNVHMQERSLNFNKNLLKTFNMGQGRLISSLLWIHTVMESDWDHYKEKDLNSWMYLRFSSMINLEPDFYQAYLYGGQYLSAVKDDIYGAREILDLGTKKFPNDFWLHFHAGFNYYFELGDAENAVKHYEQILTHPLMHAHAPYLPSIHAKLIAHLGDSKAAYLLMRTAYENIPEGNPLKKKFYKNLYSAKAEFDLKCLNQGQSNCDPIDLEGEKYLKGEDGKYRAQRNWKKFNLKVKRKVNWEKKEK